MSAISKRDKIFIASLLFPTLFFLSFVEFIPIIYALLYSFTQSSIFNPTLNFIGLNNYINIIHSTFFWHDVINTLEYGSVTAIVQTFLGLGLAFLFKDKKGSLSTIAKALIFIPYALPYVSVSLVWKFLLDPQYGFVNKIMLALRLISEPIDFFGNPNNAMWSVMLVTIWQFYPFAMIILYAALETVPKDRIEAAQVDGAGSVQVFKYVTWPYIRKIFFITLFLRFLFNTGKFDHVWLLTGGGPLGVTETLPVVAWITSFQQYNYGAATSIAILNLLLLIPFLLLFLFSVYKER